MTTRSSSPATTFAALGLRTDLIDALSANGITAPFPIQAATLPDTLAGRDVLARGKTGSGKTLAFSIPMVHRLAGVAVTPARPAGLILAPTRELATQIAATLEPMATACGLRVTTIFGGVPQNRQARALKTAQIVVACPGRLEDLMKQGLVSLDAVRITVLDEADHMADLGFLPGVTRILAATPDTGQRLLFSATLDNGVNKLVKRFLRNPLSHSVDEAHSPVPAMTHHIFEVTDAGAKRDLVQVLASGTGRRILFMRTKHHARRLAKQLTAVGIPATDLHGNLSQAVRDRNLAAFAAGTARVLVATDIAARGVHVDDVELVVHVDPPAEHKAYLHRSGRTARAGSSGDVVTVVLPEQRRDVAALLRKAAITATPQRVTGNSAEVTTLVGPIAPLVTARPEPAATSPERDRRPAARKATVSDARRAHSGRTRGTGESPGRGRHIGTGTATRTADSRGSGSQAPARPPRTRHADRSATRAAESARTGSETPARGGRPRHADRTTADASGTRSQAPRRAARLEVTRHADRVAESSTRSQASARPQRTRTGGQPAARQTGRR
ncbi:ATP-dependent RNA helicase rhlE [Nocardia otitidiscaviarum]|uniref:ATP-dependent RNA helicase rhlE n=1 Tax=Nocardia otitidiscaviarum TaxID=1823 RepID=A0A378YU27_9NOCA|nr:DEAD/DEAH box helicase [Nocardia otitidiscaviarum]SUA80672.1 ATP-dependent RNA helicase rhlE [Nocardia otitidiscaviarum]